MLNERKVVVMVVPTHLHDEESGRFAARIKPLGLTAYGNSRDESLRKVRRMFASAVSAHREKGDLEGWLDGSGLEWSWLDEYAGEAPVEYADAPEEARSSQPPNWRDFDFFAGMAA